MENQETKNINPISPSVQTPISPAPTIIPTTAPKKSVFPIFFVVLILILLTATGIFAYQNWQLRQRLNAPTTYAECIKAPGSVLQESYPATCVTKDGKKSFKQILTDDEKKKLQPPADPTATWKTYTNDKYQFSFKYPSSLIPPDPVGYEHTGYKNSTDYQNSLSKTTAVTDRLFEFNVNSFPKETYPDKAKLTFDELIESEVYCGGDGVEISFHCDKLLTSESFVTNNGAQGKKLIYTIITTNSTKKSITQQQSGNIYAFNLSDAITSRIIFFHTPNFFAPNSEDQKVFDQILSTFKFTKENLLNSTFSVTLPDPFRLMRSTENIASYGFDTVEYLVVTNVPTIKLQSLRPSTECGKLTTGQYCLYSEGTGQTKDIADVTVGGIPAKSFYISGGNDNAYHVMQTTRAPLLEFKMNVAGGGLDQRFQNFLDTIKFL